MSKRQSRKKRINFKRVIKLLIIISIIVFSIYKLIQWNFSHEDITYSLEYGEIYIEDDYKALVIRKEKVLTSNSFGEIIQVANEGEKIKKNQRILEIKNIDNIDLVDEVLENDSNMGVEIVNLTIDEVIRDIQFIKEEIAEKIKNEDYEDIEVLAEGLKLKIEKKRIMSEQSNEVISSYSENSVGSGNLLVGESESIYSPDSGILTYYIDGYEDDLTYERVIYLEYDQIEMLDIEPYIPSSNIVKLGDKICKVIDDSSWYLIIVVDKGKQNQYDVNKELEVKIDNRILTGYIEEIFPTSDRVALAIKFEETVDDFYKKRFLNVSITQDSFKGLIINTSSLVKTVDGFGIYVVDKYKKVIYKPVKILRYNDNTAIIKEDAFYEFVGEENIRIDTVSIYDRVIINSENFLPGDIID